MNNSKKLSIAIATIIALSMMCGCRFPKEVAVSQDSIVTIVHERIVEVLDTSFVEIPAESANHNGGQSSHLETSMAISDAWIDTTGELHHTLDNIPQRIQIPKVIYVPVTDTNHSELHSSDNTKVVEVERNFHWWEESLMSFGAITLIVLLIYIVITIVRKNTHAT